MKDKHVRVMSPRQRLRLQSLLLSGIPDLSFVEAESAIRASGTLLQGTHAAFEPFMRSQRGQSVAVSESQESEFTLEVPYYRTGTIRRLLKAGNYDWQNADVSDKHFPQSQVGNKKITMRLMNFKRVIGTDGVLKKFEKLNLRATNPAELLALGAKHPWLQHRYPIVALGQKWPLPNGDELVVCLAWHSMLRRVHLLCQFRRDWPAHCRFSAVVE
ncbi:MAG: hypothetical protein WA058_00280 [Minisyncoccia bacterium]